jgi:hypothetical protein
MSYHHENHGEGTASISLVLVNGGGEGEVEEDKPRPSDFGKHFKVDRTNSRVQPSTNKKIIN